MAGRMLLESDASAVAAAKVAAAANTSLQWFNCSGSSEGVEVSHENIVGVLTAHRAKLRFSCSASGVLYCVSSCSDFGATAVYETPSGSLHSIPPRYLDL